MDDTTDQFDDDADARLEEPTETATGIVQGEGNDTEMAEAQQGNENLEITQEQVVEDAHVTISTVPKKTEVPVTSSSCSSDLASKFLNFLDIPQTDAEIVSPLDVHVHHEVPNKLKPPTLLTIPATPTPPPTIETTNPLSNLPDFSSIFRFNDRITTLEKEVVDLKKDPLHTQVASLVDSHLDTRFCPKKCPNLLRTLIEMLIERINVIGSYSNTVLHTQSTYELHHTVAQKDKDKDEDPSAFGSNRVKKRKDKQRLLNQHGPKKKDFYIGSSKGTKAGNLGDNEDEPRDETASRLDWFKKPTPPQEPTDLDWNVGKLTKEVTHVSVMRKHGYGYLEEIVVRRADNVLYRFKEGDDVADFAIALRMFTRSLEKAPVHSDELYKFSDGTLTRLLSSLEDITKNIDMTFLPKRRWSNLEKKRAHFMINDINKLLKERRMMRSLKKFVGGRLYRTDLRLLQRTI
ncbi:hypothetical protein Tco_0608946 [Tanacetum coccineum]